ncbi:unnamed protein product [Mycena citricolor]|uniref:Uncharacterized protein n=1 Tax=Mycena citricolor TaxID=2018698 RepID=A0AAD2HBC3_9AGAR|nr:unnamed protein product [Mycena citricolor]
MRHDRASRTRMCTPTVEVYRIAMHYRLGLRGGDVQRPQRLRAASNGALRRVSRSWGGFGRHQSPAYGSAVECVTTRSLPPLSAAKRCSTDVHRPDARIVEHCLAARGNALRRLQLGQRSRNDRNRSAQGFGAHSQMDRHRPTSVSGVKREGRKEDTSFCSNSTGSGLSS